jgi:hypothetical protein
VPAGKFRGGFGTSQCNRKIFGENSREQAGNSPGTIREAAPHIRETAASPFVHHPSASSAGAGYDTKMAILPAADHD